MNINNPTTFGSPSLTLSTSNSSGTGGALRSDDTILVYDTTAVDAITFGQSGNVGTATTAPRRDHAHAMAALSNAGVSDFDAVCKVWGYTTAPGVLLAGSYNVASLTDDGTGDRTVVVDTDFADNDYAIALQCLTGETVGVHFDTDPMVVGAFSYQIYRNISDALQDSEGGFQAIGNQ